MMEIHGPSDVIENAVISAQIVTDTFSIGTTEPLIWQLDEAVTAVVVPIPTEFVMDWLTRSMSYEFSLELNEQFDPIYVRGGLEMSRENLIFAANNCDNSPQ